MYLKNGPRGRFFGTHTVNSRWGVPFHKIGPARASSATRLTSHASAARCRSAVAMTHVKGCSRKF
eukprot:3321737-Prymnesium_polylepis.1